MYSLLFVTSLHAEYIHFKGLEAEKKGETKGELLEKYRGYRKDKWSEKNPKAGKEEEAEEEAAAEEEVAAEEEAAEGEGEAAEGEGEGEGEAAEGEGEALED